MNHYDYCAQFIAPREKILDIGSGRGKFACEMAKRGFEVSGVEVNLDYIHELLAKADSEGVRIQIIQTKAEELPFTDNCFDFVNCAEVSEHVDAPRQMCKEIYRVLKPGGKCYISFHNRFGIYDYHYRLYFINWLPRSWTDFFLKLMKKQKSDGEAGRQKLTTMHYYTYTQAILLLRQIGFLIKDIRVEKIKKMYGAFSLFFLLLYFFLKPFCFNTFHLLISKPKE